MGSGNFEIGRHLSMNGFNEYVKPSLNKYKAKITDIMSYTDKNNKKILVSLKGGEGNQFALENLVKISLSEAYYNLLCDEENNPQNRGNILPAMPYQVKDFEGEKFNTIGLYQDNETASKVFQSLAIEYSAKNIGIILDEAKNKIKNFGEKFSEF
jgi:hypothetical protein